jgi:hypothetical protein
MARCLPPFVIKPAIYLVGSIIGLKLSFSQSSALSAGDLGVEIDYGMGNPPGTLQRLDCGVWRDYSRDGEVITSESLDIESLPSGKYRIVPVQT